MNWWYWKQIIPLPFTESVGVGSNSFTITKSTEKELFEFLESDEFLLMWSTHTDIAVLANMCNLNIHTFNYNFPNQPPCWYTTPPDQYLTYYAATMDNGPTRDVALYNSNNCHYDLLVTPDSQLALLGTARVSSYLSQKPAVVPVSLQEDEPEPVILEADVASPCLKRAAPHLIDVPSVSPLNFLPCPKGPGRPRAGRQGTASTKRKPDEGPTEQPPKKRRGRPPGSKNKPKTAPEAEKGSTNLRDRAEMAVSRDNTLPFFDSGDICNICLFALNDPVKKLKKITMCPTCSEYVHEPCLVKIGCTC